MSENGEDLTIHCSQRCYPWQCFILPLEFDLCGKVDGVTPVPLLFLRLNLFHAQFMCNSSSSYAPIVCKCGPPGLVLPDSLGLSNKVYNYEHLEMYLSGWITTWLGNNSTQNHKKLKKVVDVTLSITQPTSSHQLHLQFMLPQERHQHN